MRIRGRSLLRTRGRLLAFAVVLLARASASAAPSTEPGVRVCPGQPVVAVDLEGLPRASADRADPSYSGLACLRLDGLHPRSFSLAGVLNFPPTPSVVPPGSLQFESTLPDLRRKR